jgi:hypothetical protein
VSAFSQTTLLLYQRCFRQRCCCISGGSDNAAAVSAVVQTTLLLYQQWFRQRCCCISGVSDTARVWNQQCRATAVAVLSATLPALSPTPMLQHQRSSAPLMLNQQCLRHNADLCSSFHSSANLKQNSKKTLDCISRV